MLEEIKSVIGKTIEELGLQEGVKRAQLFILWDEIVGEEIARHAQPVKVKKDIAFITTANPVWAQELSLMKMDLIRKINKRLDEGKIKELIFFPRGVPTGTKHDPGQASINLTEVPLSKGDIKGIDAVVETLENQELREKLKAVIVLDKKLKKYQKKDDKNQD